MRKKSRNTKSSTHAPIESLESRFLLANIHFVDAYFTDADGNKLTSVAVGNQPFLQVEFTTTGLSAAAHYDVSTSLGGRTFVNTLNWGAGLASGNWVYRVGQYLIKPAILATYNVTLDSGGDVAETDETDNGTTRFYAGVTFGPGFNKPLEGTPNVDWSILNYNDTDAAYPDDQGFAGACEDFRGGPYCYDGHNGWDILPATWKQGYNGIDIFAAAAGTVVQVEDGADDHNTQALGQPSNMVMIDHGGGWMTQYHHMAKNSITVSVGQVITQAQVNAGFKIGEMGSSGNSTYLHLHWGVYYNDQLVEPMTDTADYLNYSLAYSGDAPTVLGTGITNYEPSPEIDEGPSDASTFLTNIVGQTVYSWVVLAGVDPSDQVRAVWHRPDNSIAFTGGPWTGYNRRAGTTATFNLPFAADAGTWRVDWSINNVIKKSAFFTVQDPLGEAQAHIYHGLEYIVDGRRSPLHFGTLINSQTTAPSMTFTVKNSGQVALTTTGLNIPAGFFLAGGSSLAASIPAGGQDSFTVFADVFQTGHHEGYISFLSNDHSPGELVQSFKIDDDVLSASDAINSLLSDANDSVYIRRENGQANAQIWVNSNAIAPTWTIPITQMANLVVNTLGGNDILTVDFRYGTPLNATGMDYNAGSGDDQFSLLGSPNNDAILLGNHQAWLGLSHVDITGVDHNLADGSDGDDTITIGGAGTNQLDEAGLDITVTGGNGTDHLVLNDQDDTGNDDYLINGTVFSKTGVPALEYHTFENLTLNANGADNTVRVYSTLETLAVTVNAGDGNDTINVSAATAKLEDIKGDLTVNGGAGTDAMILFDQNHAAVETFGINSAAITSTRTGLIPNSFGVSYATIEDATIDAGIGGSTFNIQGSNAATPLTINAGGGSDIFNVTPVGKNLGAIDGELHLNGEAGNDFLTIDDSLFGVPGFTINSFSDVSFTSSHSAQISYPNLEHIIYNNGDDGGLTTIKSLPAGLLSLVFNGNGGSDSLLVGEAATGLAPLGQTALAIDGGAGGDSVTIHDDANSANDSYSLTSTTFDKTNFNTLNYTTLESLSLTAGTGNNFINVTSATIPMSISGNDGGDTINLATGNLSNIISPITFSGDAGIDNITLRDLAFAFGSTTTITPTTVTRAFFGGLTYFTSERLTLDAQDVASDIEVNGTAPGMSVTVNPNGGTDIVNVNETDPTSPVTVTPSTGDDTVNINSDATGSAGVLFPATILLGTLNINSGGRADIAAGGSEKVLRTNNLNLNGTGKLNIADHSAIVQATAATRLAVLGAVQNYIKSAHDGTPAWTGVGLTSASAAANPASRAVGYMLNGTGGTTYATFDGQAVDLNSILIRYTVVGDLNLDKTVSISDFIDLSSNFNLAGGWREGDLNYDKQVSISDFIDLSSNFGQVLSGEATPIPVQPMAANSLEITPLSDALDTTITSISKTKKIAGARRTIHHRHHRRHR